MTTISRDDVQYLAQLSNLQLTADETEHLQGDLEHILDYINQLAELDTSGVEPTYQVIDDVDTSREDVINNYGIERDALLALAPDAKEYQIKVPKVL